MVIYLGTAPKSNAIYTAYGAARGAAKATGIADAAGAYPQRADKLMKDLGYGSGYEYDHGPRMRSPGRITFPTA